MLIIMDMVSRGTEISILNNIKTKNIVEKLKTEWNDKYGPSKTILTDQGRQFISTNFKNFYHKKKIKHVRTSPYNPTDKKIVERINSQIGNILRI